MKLKEILKGAGKMALNSVFPGAVQVINGILPEPITGNETGEELAAKITDPAILEKEIDYKIIESNNYKELAIAQEQSNSSTRPRIALLMTYSFIGMTLLSFLTVWISMYYDVTHDTKITKIVMSNLHWIALSYGVPTVGVVQQYFARRSDDKRNAHAAASGMNLQPHDRDWETIR